MFLEKRSLIKQQLPWEAVQFSERPKSKTFVYFSKITAATWSIDKIIPVYIALTKVTSLIQVVKKSMDDLDLQAHAMNKCQDLSGGTKRKLCAAIAMLGSPHLILMDEPTRYLIFMLASLMLRK